MSATQEDRGGKGYGKHASYGSSPASGNSSSLVFGGFWILLFISTFLVGGPWAGFHAVMLGGAGLLMLLCPPAVSLPKLWWILAALFVILGLAQFLPAAWFPMPEWRGKLESLGLDTGKLVVIQSRQAAEAYTLFIITLLTGLWLAGHRPSTTQLRHWSLTFVIGVAIYAIFSKLRYAPDTGGVYGFFPNRNHTATYLAMGSVCGLGCILQALRDKRFLAMAVALIATGVCLWAVAGWSISRGGVVLVVVGCLAWVSMLGRRYLGQHGIRALGLIALAAVGFFFLADSVVKQRMSETVEKANKISAAADAGDPSDSKKDEPQKVTDLDFRLPTALDALDLIKDFKWTGVGAAQFFYIYPQYRTRSALLFDYDQLHPESDWLWMASETGILATVALAILVIFAFSKTIVEILDGRDRAVRSACLVAAFLVPFHGIFDVPGHRIPLAWAAAFLFMLSSKKSSSEQLSAKAFEMWLFRSSGLVMLIVAAMLARAQWWDGPQPASTAASHALEEAHRLFQEDKDLQKEVVAKGMAYQPDPSEDRLEKALVVLKQARDPVPLDRELIRYQEYLAFDFDDKYDLIDHSSSIELALDPKWVTSPLLLASAWAPIDPQRSLKFWKEAMLRAEVLDRLHSVRPSMSERTLSKIRQAAHGKPELESLLPMIQ